jgi:hypothetical protein
VVFDNHQIDVSGNVAIAMGNYFFTSAADSKTKSGVIIPPVASVLDDGFTAHCACKKDR